jgi:outer membrane immunogenic protein
MKKVLAASVLVVGTAYSAYAADLGPAYRAPPPLAPPPPSWTGCYVDGGGGYGLWNIDHNFQSTTTATAQTTSGGRGGFGIVGGGCDYQFSPATGWGNWVVGAFADYEFMDLKRNLEETGLSGNEKESSAWGVGARIGYLVTPNVYTYTNGGYTQTHFDQVNLSLNFSPFTPTAFIPGHSYDGWFIGGGTEISLSGFFGLPLPPGLFLRSEYRFSSYNSAALPVFGTNGAPLTGLGNSPVENMRPYVQTIWTALVYRFNWTGR